MHAEPDRDFFLVAAMDWAAVRDRHPLAATLSREAAYCHLLFRAGKHAAVLARLRVISRDALGGRVPNFRPDQTPDAARVLAAAADLFHRLRLAVVPAGAVA